MATKVPLSFAEEVEAFLSLTGMLPTTFGKAAMSDPAFVFKLRAGRRHRIDTAEKVRAFMAANRPGRRRKARPADSEGVAA